MIGYIPYTPRVKRVLSLAAKESRALNHSYVGTEHILLGLLLEGDGVAARVLTSLGVGITRIREEILSEADTEDPGAISSTGPDESSKGSHEPSLIEGEGSLTPRAQQVMALA